MFTAKDSIYHRSIAFVMSICLALAVHSPARSQSDALELALQAQQLYDAGQITQAALVWQQAAIAFEVIPINNMKIKKQKKYRGKSIGQLLLFPPIYR